MGALAGSDLCLDPLQRRRAQLGTVRYMSSELAAKKPEMRAFMERYGNR